MRESEIKILEKLKEKKEGLSFSELEKETGYSYQTLSICLKNLQRLNLIERDFETRKYRAKELSYKVLYLNDLMNILQNKIDFSFFGLIPLISMNKEIEKEILKIYEDEKIRKSLEYINKKVKEKIREYALSKFNKEIIEKYENAIRRYLFILYKDKFVYEQDGDILYFNFYRYEKNEINEHLTEEEINELKKLKKEILEKNEYKNIYEKFINLLKEIKVMLVFQRHFEGKFFESFEKIIGKKEIDEHVYKIKKGYIAREN